MSKPIIKFRGQPIEDYGDIKWFYGSAILDYEEKLAYIDSPGQGIVPVFWDTVGQYFGRRDGNSKEIYKGDIIEYSYVYNGETRKFTAYVDWSDELLGYCLRNMDGTWKSEAHSYDFEANSVIIGNTYEHQHLLKGDSKDA